MASGSRKISYLRISVTDLCNLRCRYCMPAGGVDKRGHGDILRNEEIIKITRAAAEVGITKVRITGGEPLVRRGILELCRDIAAIPGIEELAMTTNGELLADAAQDLKAAGVSRLNISIDSLNPQKYAEMTRGGSLKNVLLGIRAARKAGIWPVKLNTVLIGGFNDDEIEDFAALTKSYDLIVRFIELMPIGEGVSLWKGGYLPNKIVLEALPELEPAGGDGVSRLYAFPGAPGMVGLINPISNHFCLSCNRLRLTSDGMLKPCLHSSLEIPVRGLEGSDLKSAVLRAIEQKPEFRDELSGESPSAAGRNMNQIGG